MINSKSSQLYKNKKPHCSHSVTELENHIHCWKCITVSNRLSRKFKTCQTLFYHLTLVHSRGDKFISPTRDECIDRLQKISDELIAGELKH